MATEMTRRINLEYPDFTVHDIIATDLYYNDNRDTYIMNYYDLTLNNSMYTVLSRVNGRLVKNPFMENEQIQEIAIDAKPADLSILADSIRCLKVPLQKPAEQRVTQFDVFTTERGEFYIRLGLASRFNIPLNNVMSFDDVYPGVQMVSVSNEDINRIVNLTRNDSVRLEPVYHPIVRTQRVALFKVLDDDRDLFITRSLARRFGMDHGFALRYESVAWTRVTMQEVEEIERRTKEDPVCLKPKFQRITRYNTIRHKDEGPRTQEQAIFIVLDDGENLFINRQLARQYGVDHGYAFRKDGLEWTRVSLADVKRIEELNRFSQVALKAKFEKISRVNDYLKPNNKAFTVVIDVLTDDKDLYIRKEVADRFNIKGNAISYDTYMWIKVTEEDLARIKMSYNERNALVEFKYVKMEKTTTLADDEFEVLVDGENQYISIDIVNRFNIDNTGIINVNGKHYCKVSDKDIKKIMAASFYSDVSLRPKYIMITKEKSKKEVKDKRLVLNYCIIDNKKFVPANLPLDMELDLMSGKKVRIDGEIYVAVSDQRFQEIFNDLMMAGYRVTLNYKEVERVNKKQDDNKKITK